MAPKKNKKNSRKRAKLQKVLPFLQAIKNLNPAHRSVLMNHLDDDSWDLLFQTVSNVISNPLIPGKRKLHLKRQLSRYKAPLRHIANKNASKSSRKKKMLQMGGNPLALILSTAIPLLLDILRK